MNSNEQVLIKRTAKKLKEARLAKGLRQIDVSARAGITVNYYALVERGEKNPTTTVFQKIINAIGIKANDILGD